MYYEINVSLNGVHFFATAERSCTTYNQAIKVYKELEKRFPASEGYELTLRAWETIGKEIKVE